MNILHEKRRAQGFYPLVAAAVIGSAVVGSVASASASKSAAKAQQGAAEQSDATQRYFYDTTRADNAPFRNTGIAANNRLATLMGLNPAPTDPADQEFDKAYYLAQNPDIAADPYYSLHPEEHYNRFGSEEGRLPAAAIAPVDNSTDPAFGSLMRKFGASDLASDAVYQSGLQFGLDEGTKGINRQAAAGGSYLSGATLKALTRFGNDYGSTKANESYNRFNTDQNSQYNKLAGLSGAGQQATNQVSAAGTNAANQISSSQLGAGNARASGYVGQANALTSGMSSAYNNYQQNRLINQFGSGGGSAYSSNVGSDPYSGYNKSIGLS